MASKGTSFEQLVVRGQAGLAYDEAAAETAIRATTYDSSLIKLTAKLEMSLMLLNSHVALEEFTVDIVVAREEEEQETGGVLSFIQERIVGSKKAPKNKVNKSEAALKRAYDACVAKGYHGLYVIAKVTPETLPDNACRQRYTPGQYAEALLNGCRAHFMFQRHNTFFEADSLRLWVDGGGGCLAPVEVCYIVLAWRMNEVETGPITFSPIRLQKRTTTTTTTAPAAAAAAPVPKLSCKRPATTQNNNDDDDGPPRKRQMIKNKVSKPLNTYQDIVRKEEEEEEEEMEEEEEEEEMEEVTPKDKIPEVWYSPDITQARQQSPPTKKTANQKPQRVNTPANHQQPSAPQPTNQQPRAPLRTANQQPPAPEKLTNQQPPAPGKEEEEEEKIFGFERSTPKRGRPRKSVAAAAAAAPPSRKSVLVPQWCEEDKEELLRFFDTLNPTQTEQTSIALTCKFATMRFGRDLSSKQLYQWVQQKGRTIHQQLDTYTLPDGKESVREAAVNLFRSLNPDVTEGKRVAFTCRFMQTQFGAEINSKELYGALAGKKKRGGKAC